MLVTLGFFTFLVRTEWGALRRIKFPEEWNESVKQSEERGSIVRQALSGSYLVVYIQIRKWILILPAFFEKFYSLFASLFQKLILV